MKVKICKDCIYHTYGEINFVHNCIFDAIQHIDLVTGTVTYTRMIECYKRREPGGLCGEAGKLFKSKDGDEVDDVKLS